MREGEKEHENLFRADEKVVTELKGYSSQNVEKMDMEEIAGLLRESMKSHH